MFSFDLLERRKSIHLATVVMDKRLEIGRRNMKHRTSRENHCPFNDILHFTDVSRPGTSTLMVSEKIVSICFFMLRATCWAKCRTRKGCLRYVPVGPDMDWNYVQPIKHIGTKCLLPDHCAQIATGRSNKARVCAKGTKTALTLNNFVCRSNGISPTSSRNMVPGEDNSNRPIRCVTAPVNAPLLCPKSLLSSSPVGIAEIHVINNHNSRMPDTRGSICPTRWSCLARAR